MTTRSLWPREHGAYGQLLLPLLVALATGSGALAAWLCALGAMALFFAHEPLLVLLGQRGSRALREHGQRASWLFGAQLAFALVLGVLVVTTAPQPVARAAIFPVVLSACPALLLWKGREKTGLGELSVAAALPAFAVPVAVAGDVRLAEALQAWCVWWLGTSAATAAVRGVIGHAKHGIGLQGRLILPLMATLAIALLALQGVLRPGESVAALPMLLGALWLAAWPPRPRHLRTVGWTLVAASILTALLLVGAAKGVT